MDKKTIQFHITVKGIVIYRGKTLIMKRVRPSSDGLGYWELPGGGLEYGETGLDIKILKPVYTFTKIRKNYQTVGIGFLCIPVNNHVVISEEHTEYRFVDEEELRQMLNKEIYEDIKEAISEYNHLVEYHQLRKMNNE